MCVCVNSRVRPSALQSETAPRCSQPPEEQCELGDPGGFRVDLQDARSPSDIIRPVLSALGSSLSPCLGAGSCPLDHCLVSSCCSSGFPPRSGAIGCHSHPCSNSEAWPWLNHEEESKVPPLRRGRRRERERAGCGCAWEQPV